MKKISTTLYILLVYAFVQAQPVLLKELPNNSQNFVSSNGILYYTVGDSLWKSNGTVAGTLFVKELNESEISLTGLTVGTSFFFTSKELSGKRALWKSDGTAVNTVKIAAYNQVTPLLVFGGALYLSINNGTNGTELWKTTGAVPTIVKDINLGSGNGFVGNLMISSGQLFFQANAGSGGVNIWKSNGTTAGTLLAADVAFDDYSYLTDVNGMIYFGRNTEGTHEYGSNSKAELWKTNGTSAGTFLVKRFAQNEQPGYEESYESISDFYVANGKLYFLYYTNYSNSLPIYFFYESNGTEAGTVEIRQITLDGYINFFTEAKGKIVYQGNGQSFPNAIRGYDPATTTHFSLKPEADEFTSEHVHEYELVGNYFFFADAIDAYMGGVSGEDSKQLWQTDLTPGNAKAVKTLFKGTDFAGTSNLTAANDKLFFTTQASYYQANPATMKKRLWYYDPTKPVVPVPYFTLVNADTDQEIQVLEMGDQISKPANTNISIRYHQVGTPGSVVFKLADTIRRIENGAPYLLAGDVNGNYSPWLEAKTGVHKVTGIPYTQAGGNGTAGAPTIVEFYIKGLSNYPIAYAGQTRIVIPPKDSVIIYGEDRDDGTITQRIWSKISGPFANVSYIDNKLMVQNMVAGYYVFRYGVYDNEGQYVFDDVDVVVYEPDPGDMRVALVNSTTDQDIRDLKLNDTIVYNSSTDKITIRAIPTQSVGSVKFFLNNNLFRTENTAPYALQGDGNGNYNAWAATYGTHNLIVRAYSGSNGSGTLLEEKTIQLVIKQPGSTPPSASNITFTLVNAVTDQDIGPLVNGQTINLSSLPTNKLNIRANSTLANTKSIAFAWDGNSNYKTENTAPYALFGDNNGNYAEWSAVNGSHTLKATPYTGTNKTGTAGAPLEITFTITNSQPLMQTASLKTYPNPTAERLSIDLENFEAENVSISIYDELGSQYYEGTQQVLNGSGNYEINLLDLNMKPGIYMVRIKSTNTSEEKVMKILKE